MTEQTHRIGLSGYDEARASYVEELAEAEKETERAAALQREAQAIREAAEHDGDELVILHYRPFGAVLDAQAALVSGNFAGRGVAVLRNAIVSWRLGEAHGEAVTDEWIRAQDGDLMAWVLAEVEAHWEAVRRTAPKVTRTST